MDVDELDETKAPPKPWPFPPTHIMPTGPNGTKRGCWHCVRCGRLIREDGKSMFTLVGRCDGQYTEGRRVGKIPYRIGGRGNVS